MRMVYWQAILMKNTIFLKLGIMSQNLSSAAAVVIGA